MTSLYDQADVKPRLRPTRIECKVNFFDFKLKQVYSTLAVYTNHIRVVFCSLQAGTLFQLTPDQRHGCVGVTRTVDLQCCQLTRRPAARSVNNQLPLFCCSLADTHLTATLNDSCAACKSHGKEWLLLVNLRGKTRQLAPVVSTSFRKTTAKQQVSKSNPPRRHKSLLLLTKGEPVQSANVYFLRNL